MDKNVHIYSHSVLARTSTVLVARFLVLTLCGLLLGVGSVKVVRGQQGEEEFQRKMDELKQRNKQQKQTGEERKQSSEASDMEMPQVPGGVPNRNIPASPGMCKQKYDRFRDTTTLDMAVGTIFKTNNASAPKMSQANGGRVRVEELRLALAATMSGRQGGATPPQQVDWYFQSTALSYRYHTEAEVLMIIDGERVRVGNAYALGGVPIMSEILERFRLRVTAELFSRINKGRVVEVKIGTNEFRVSPDALKALRAFATCADLK